MIKDNIKAFHEYVNQYTRGTVRCGGPTNILWFIMRDAAIGLPWFFKNRKCSVTTELEFDAGDIVARTHNFLSWYSWWLREGKRVRELSCNSRPKHKSLHPCHAVRTCPFCLFKDCAFPLYKKMQGSCPSGRHVLFRARMVWTEATIFSKEDYAECSKFRETLVQFFHRRGVHLTARLSVYASERCRVIRPELNMLWWGIRDDDSLCDRLSDPGGLWRRTLCRAMPGTARNLQGQVGLFWRYPGWIFSKRYTEDFHDYVESPFYRTRVGR